MSVKGNMLLRLVEPSDVDFILSLRTNKNLNCYLNHVPDDKIMQLGWIKQYKQRELSGTDYYFVIVDKIVGDIGLIRVYDIDYTQKKFVWGSWVLKEDRPKQAALISMLLMYEFAFNELQLETCSVFADNFNERMIKLQHRFGVNFLYSDEKSSFFRLTKLEYLSLKYSRYYNWFI